MAGVCECRCMLASTYIPAHAPASTQVTHLFTGLTNVTWDRGQMIDTCIPTMPRSSSSPLFKPEVVETEGKQRAWWG